MTPPDFADLGLDPYDPYDPALACIPVVSLVPHRCRRGRLWVKRTGPRRGAFHMPAWDQEAVDRSVADPPCYCGICHKWFRVSDDHGHTVTCTERRALGRLS